MQQAIRFTEIKQRIKGGLVGVYRIHTKSGRPLKVGIAKDLCKRLLRHHASRQNALKVKPGGKRSRPEDVRSKQSILAKHLYYDAAIAPGYRLTTEIGRRSFLEDCCLIFVQPTNGIDKARGIEEHLENSGGFRYVGRVRIRRTED